MWLYWRAERQRYCIARYDRAAGSSRYVSTDIGAGDGIDPPSAAHEALAAAFAARARPAAPAAPAEVSVSDVLRRYLAEHCAHVAAPERPAYAVMALEKYIAHQRRSGAVDGVLSVAQLGKTFVAGYATFRRSDGIADSTIKRELGTLRAATNWAADDEMIAVKPHIPKLLGAHRLKTGRREIAYNLPQLAAILEAAWALQSRRHVHLFIIAMLASHARTEAILECDLDVQYRDGAIDWLGHDREQTKKRRAIVPVGPTFASWLKGRSGKLIRYQVEKAKGTWADSQTPEYIQRHTESMHSGFRACLIAAGEAHPSLNLRRPDLDANGNQRARIKHIRDTSIAGGWRAVEAQLWLPVGSPNTIRHSIHTQLSRIGVPKGQIDAAAGHAEQGTGQHYNHFNAHHDLKDFVAGTEQLFDELQRFTKVHLRTQDGPKVFELAPKISGFGG
jgi:hypothetical protein